MGETFEVTVSVSVRKLLGDTKVCPAAVRFEAVGQAGSPAMGLRDALQNGLAKFLAEEFGATVATVEAKEVG